MPIPDCIRITANTDGAQRPEKRPTAATLAGNTDPDGRNDRAAIISHKDIVRTAVTTYYFPEIHFTYQLGGQQFNQKNFGIPKREYWHTERAKAQVLLDSILELPMAYINPENPAESCLMRGNLLVSRAHSTALIVAGILLILCGVGIYWLIT